MRNERRTLLNRNEMVRVKARALRKGIWFRVLTRTERACVDLTIKVVERVRSRLLQNVLSSVIMKLQDAMESKFRCLMRDVGENLAQKVSQIAQDWGNASALEWSGNPAFIQYLTAIYVNESP